MKKRIEKVVERTESSRHLTIGKKYPVHSESKGSYSVKDDEGDIGCWDKSGFIVVSEREVLEFDIEELSFYNKNEDKKNWVIYFESPISLTKYDIKVIATPKDKKYEEMSKEELIELLKAKE